MDPGSSLKPHFHRAHQFQVVTGGDGFFGKTPARPLMVQYAGAGTPYGPLLAGERGLDYLTLRNTYDPGSRVMPDSRLELKEYVRKPRQRISEIVPLATPDQLKKLKAEQSVDVIPQEEDGLAGWVFRYGPGAPVEGPDPSAGGGQHWVVLSGGLLVDGATLEEGTPIFVEPGDDPLTAKASAGGCEVLALQYQKDMPS
jgi:hypothetical protein